MAEQQTPTLHLALTLQEYLFIVWRRRDGHLSRHPRSQEHRAMSADTMDCQECGWQGPSRECDSTYCPICGGECVPWGDIYNDDGTPKETDHG